MESKNLLFGFLLCYILLTTTYSHMAIEENTEQSLANSNKMNLPDLPPISIVELTKASRKISRKEAETKISSKLYSGCSWKRKRPFPSAFSKLYAVVPFPS
ncbi:agouti-signaling protein isoform X2 [Alligator sinensis]|uniref:Agouti-signaling protein isoform X2 n=1 Tax=Alligator sinensis TaxID=38654 RepID=A0A3Q0H3A4_ALLSI|nr:agouti-signaling protein isoform X2 [Alligator sinensis]